VARFGGASRAFVGEQATEVALKQLELVPFGIVHFATHAFSNRERPARSAVLLASGAESEDGLFQPREIAALDLRGKLVLLSTCDSAEGPLVHGDGPLSLARAFLRAGARGVVGTLWPVRDDEAAALMRRFYGHLARGASTAAALAQAQADSAAAGLAPAAWAGYVLIGDGSAGLAALPPHEDSTRWRGIALAITALAALAAALGLLATRRRSVR
jgi:CHAT domain-containing protein